MNPVISSLRYGVCSGGSSDSGIDQGEQSAGRGRVAPVSFKADRRLDIVEPEPEEEVELPMEVAWEVDDFELGRPRGLRGSTVGAVVGGLAALHHGLGHPATLGVTAHRRRP